MPEAKKPLPLRLVRALWSPVRTALGLSTGSTIFGDARWMEKQEEKAFFSPRNKGLMLGGKRMSDKDSYTNLGLVAPTGSGKTTKYVIPNILHCTGSAIVTDPSGEIFQQTSGYMQKRGYDIKVLKPHKPNESHRFNPPKYFSTHQQARYFATTLALHGASAKTDPIWVNGPADFFYVASLALANCETPAYRNMGNLRWLINHYGVDGTAINRFMAENLQKQDYAEYKAFVAQEPKTTSNIISSARSAFNLWSDPDVVRVTATDNINITDLRKKKTITYLIVPEHLIDYYSLFLKLFYTVCFSTILEAGDQPDLLPMYFFLDEFGNLGEIPNFAAMATTLRKRRCSLSIILQSLSQLETVYGKDKAKTIFGGGMGSKLFFSGVDLDTCQYLERVLGKNTVYDTDFGGVSDRAKTVAQPLMALDEVRMIDKKSGILISGNQRPAKLEMTPFYEDSRQTRLTKIPPARLQFDYAAETELPLIPFGNER